MPARPELTAREYDTVEALPAQARALLGGDLFSDAAWYRTVIATALPAGHRAVLLVLSSDAGVAGLFAMLAGPGGVSALTTPYTCLWRPLLAPGADHAQVWRGFAAWCRTHATVRLDALDARQADTIAAALGGTGLLTLRFDHFGNWRAAGLADWASYLAARPGAVREAVRRRTRQLIGKGASFAILRTPDEIESGITAYEAVYAVSWKEPEPYPQFSAALMRACAADGSLRLGVLRLDGRVLAAQIWVVRGEEAAVLKLAHDESARALSPGTVLTALMIEQLIARDQVRALDFGRGDDAYKQSWTSERRQIVGVIVANPLTLGGLAAIGRHLGGTVRKKGCSFLKKKNQKTVV